MIYINQSLIRKFYYKGELRDYCPYSIYCEMIAKTHSRKTLPMIAGSYFETLCLGSGVKGSKTDDMPRKKLTARQILNKQKIGDKTIDQKRIEQQHLIFEKNASIFQINVQKEVNTQVRIVKRYSRNDDIILVGELDIFPTTILLPERGLRLAVIDLKLTGTFSSFGEYCWGEPSSLDNIQGLFYNNLVRDIDINLNMDINSESKINYLYTSTIKKQLETNDPLFFYWVFNYKTNNLTNKFIEVPYRTADKFDLKEAIRKTIKEYNKNVQKRWDRLNPSYETCQGCPVIECSERVSFKDNKTDNKQFDSV